MTPFWTRFLSTSALSEAQKIIPSRKPTEAPAMNAKPAMSLITSSPLVFAPSDDRERCGPLFRFGLSCGAVSLRPSCILGIERDNADRLPLHFGLELHKPSFRRLLQFRVERYRLEVSALRFLDRVEEA